MKEKDIQRQIQQENFELILNLESSRISANDLITFLSNTDLLFQSINKTLNCKYNVGYESITIEVLALEKGSFKIPIALKKIANNFLLPTTITFLGGLAANLITNNHSSQTIKTQNEEIVVENKVLLENKSTKEAISMIAKTAIETDGINGISVTYEKDNGEQERVNISKETLSQSVCNETINEEMINLQSKITLEIVSPVFMNKPASWRVSYNGRTTPINAQMADTDFLDTMDRQEIAFAKGDAIIADLETTATNTDSGIKFKYRITKVYSYPKYSRITKTSNIQQLDLLKDEQE